MVPLKLRLFNFLSYRGEAELDLRQVHVACLCGDNGHGKSALLDAITWVLLGWARGRRFGQGGASPEELVHQGQSEMEVSLEFQADGAVYQVLRKYSRGARSRSAATVLDLQAATGDGFRSLTVGSIADTERRLQRILRMEYETFVSSAFLLQGHADRFTTSAPARRKETLADILGLGLYERLEERAREHAREQEGLLLRTRLEQERLERELARTAHHQEALARAEAALGELAPRLEATGREVDRARGELQALELRQQEVETLRQAIDRGAAEAARLEAQAATVRARVEGHRRALDQRDEAEAGAARLAEAQERLAAMDGAQARYTDLSQEALRLEHAIAQARQQAQAEVSSLQERVQQDLEPRSQRLPRVEADLAAVAPALEALEGQAARVREQRAALDGLLRQVEGLGSENARLLQEMQDLRGRFDMLVPGEDLCPLCGTVLGAEGLEHLRRETRAQGLRLREMHVANQGRIREGDAERQRREGEVAAEERRIEAERGTLQARQGALARELEECRQATSSLAEARERLVALQERVRGEGFAGDLRHRLGASQRELEALGYDPERHREVRALVGTLDGYADLARRVREATERLPQEEESLADLESLAAARRDDIAGAEERAAAAARQLEALPAMQPRAVALAAEPGRLDAERGRLQGEAHLHRSRLAELEQAEAEAEALRETQRGQEDARDTYALLAEAFGKRGVQALLIEAALPELEAEANALLGRLTDNRMHLTLETQRQSRRGDVSETLEIRIADELGTRSYELFSGGEAFRINFALRVALAKLLASRSGAPLRTLFLDEGFGTQDASGRERLVEAINTIQDGFDLILVITHIEELKEAFPVRIEVSKTESGSTLQMAWG